MTPSTPKNHPVDREPNTVQQLLGVEIAKLSQEMRVLRLARHLADNEHIVQDALDKLQTMKEKLNRFGPKSVDFATNIPENVRSVRVTPEQDNGRA